MHGGCPSLESAAEESGHARALWDHSGVPTEHLNTETRLQALITTGPLLVLFGGAHCGVCQAVRPRLEDLLIRHFAGVPLAYVDCGETPALCAQQGVFCVPVLRLYVQGRLALEWARSFSLREVSVQMQRVLMLAGDGLQPS